MIKEEAIENLQCRAESLTTSLLRLVAKIRPDNTERLELIERTAHACLDLAEVILKTKDTKDIEGFWKHSMKSRLNGLAERLEES